MFKTKYKCRYCGETFYGHMTSSEDIVLKELAKSDSIMVHAHFATDYPEDPHYGIGDLLGFEVTGDAEQII